jgi:hypothetical protein
VQEAPAAGSVLMRTHQPPVTDTLLLLLLLPAVFLHAQSTSDILWLQYTAPNRRLCEHQSADHRCVTRP